MANRLSKATLRAIAVAACCAAAIVPATVASAAAVTSTSVSASPTHSTFGQSVTLSAFVVSGTTVITTGSVIFEDNGVVIGSAVSLATGTAKLTTNSLPPGYSNVTATYSGTSAYGASASSPFEVLVNPDKTATALRVSPSASIVFGQPLTLSARVIVRSPSTGTPAGRVTFMDGPKHIGSAPVSAGGVATLVIPSWQRPGPHDLRAHFDTSVGYASSMSPKVVLSVAKAATTTTLAPIGSSNFGSPTTIRASVAVLAPSLARPTGTVTFLVGRTVLAPPVSLVAGSASLTVTAPIGSRTVTAVFKGGTGIGNSQSSIGQTVAQALSTTGLVVSPSPSDYSQNVTLTASVAPVVAGLATPTGDVEFLDQGVVLATVTLVGGTASYSTDSLSVGTHALSADYIGDATYLPSSGDASTVVNPGPPPTLTVDNADGTYVAGTSVTITGTAFSNEGGTVLVDVNGAPVSVDSSGNWSVSVPLVADSSNVVTVVATDSEGLSSSSTINVISDTIAPAISVGGVSDGEYAAGPVTATFSATDVNLGSVSATMDGSPFTSGTVVSAEGPHTLVVVAVDLAGNSSTETVTFTIDTTPPVITVAGVSNGEYAAGPVTATFSGTDVNLDSFAATLDGSPIVSGTTVSAEGIHVLVVVATDLAGNLSTETVTFTIDTTPPVITVAGVSDGEIAGGPVTPTFSATDVNLDAVSATLDGSPFDSGTTVSAPGPHTLVVVATDLAGNSSEVTIHFTI